MMLLMEILILGNLSAFGLSLFTKFLAAEEGPRGGLDEAGRVDERPPGLKGSSHRFADYSNEQGHEQVHKQHKRQFPTRSLGTNSCKKQRVEHFNSIRILNVTGMSSHVTPRDVDPICILQASSTTTNTPDIQRTSTKNTIDFRGVSAADDDVIVFRLNRTDLKKVVISKAELRVFMTARNESGKVEPRKQKQSHKQHKERYSISIYGLSNDSFSILASINVRISNSKWQKFLLSTSYVQNLLNLAVDELVLKINCENCEHRLELYKGPHLNKEANNKKKNKNNNKQKHRQKKESKRQTKRAPKLMLEIKEVI